MPLFVIPRPAARSTEFAFTQTSYTQFAEGIKRGVWQNRRWTMDPLGGADPMTSDQPPLDHDRCARAAEAMIANFGTQALAEATRRAQAMRSSGCDTTADTWECICKIIRARFGVYALIGGAAAPDLLGPQTPCRLENKFSFFQTR